MSWLFVAFSIILLWMFSLWKVRYSSHSVLSRVLIFSNDKCSKRQNVLLVVAHPDDESMFFSPTIHFLVSKGHNVHILCISTAVVFSLSFILSHRLPRGGRSGGGSLPWHLVCFGGGQWHLCSSSALVGNAEGKGYIRREELYRACAVLKVPPEKVKVLDHPDLQDGFKEKWEHNLLAKIIGEEINIHDIDTVITFDKNGISGHQNHRDVHYGLCMLLRGEPQKVEAWELISTSILRKYSGPVDIWLSILYSLYWSRGLTCCLLNTHVQKSYFAMAQHGSQWVWFRKLFVLFSSYTYINTLRKINL